MSRTFSASIGEEPDIADLVFNVAKGRRGDDWTSATVKALLLKVAEADATLKDRLTVAAILAAANTEANFTNYTRKTLASKTRTQDDTNDWQTFDADDLTWLSAGGATNNTLVKLVIYKDVDGTDANAVPITALDYAEVTTGTDLVFSFNASGIWRAS